MHYKSLQLGNGLGVSDSFGVMSQNRGELEPDIFGQELDILVDGAKSLGIKPETPDVGVEKNCEHDFHHEVAGAAEGLATAAIGRNLAEFLESNNS